MTEFVQKVYFAAAKYFDGDAKRIQHFTKVLQYSALIAEGEKLSPAQEELLQTTAILHDVGIPESERKYGNCIGKHQEEEGPPVAREILTSLGAGEELIAPVCCMIGLHHSYSKIGDDLLLRILVEADMLVNAYEEEIPVQGISAFVKNIARTATGKALFALIFPAAAE